MVSEALLGMKKSWDVIVIGAGAAGLFCAAIAGERGKRVLVIDHASVIGEKIRISGGGRCNFTNIHSAPNHFLSMNPHFVKSALSKYPPKNFIDLIKQHQIPFHEKHKGQLFCDDSATQIVDMLLNDCQKAGVTLRYPESVKDIKNEEGHWSVYTNTSEEHTQAVVIATGGMPVPAIGATDFAIRFAQQLGLPVIPCRPALVPLSFTSEAFAGLSELAGLSVPVLISAGMKGQGYGVAVFDEDLLITHKGLSGPAVLQASSYWQEGQEIRIDWTHGANCDALFDDESLRLKQAETLVAELLPQRLAKYFVAQVGLLGRKWAEIGKKDRQELKRLLTAWVVKPAGTLGWKKAEVMVGGVDTRALDSQTMMAKQYPGLYFIGECVDVTGHLGGHNFQWAWSSAYACAQSLV